MASLLMYVQKCRLGFLLPSRPWLAKDSTYHRPVEVLAGCVHAGDEESKHQSNAERIKWMKHVSCNIHNKNSLNWSREQSLNYTQQIIDFDETDWTSGLFSALLPQIMSCDDQCRPVEFGRDELTFALAEEVVHSESGVNTRRASGASWVETVGEKRPLL